MIYTLCPACFDASQKRINAAIEHNPDKDVDWWADWWGLEETRQMRCVTKHKHTKETE